MTARLGVRPCNFAEASDQGTQVTSLPSEQRGVHGSEASGSHSSGSRALRVKVMSIGRAWATDRFRMLEVRVRDKSLGKDGVRVPTRTVWEQQNAGSSKKANVARRRRDFDLHSDMAFPWSKSCQIICLRAPPVSVKQRCWSRCDSSTKKVVFPNMSFRFTFTGMHQTCWAKCFNSLAPRRNLFPAFPS